VHQSIASKLLVVLSTSVVTLAPPAPVALVPTGGATSGSLTPTLVALGSVGTGLTYRFDLSTPADPTFAAPLQAVSGVVASGYSVQWTVPVPLADNSAYCWRVRAFDGVTYSPQSVGCFTATTPDTDGDGLPDWWELQYFAKVADGGGCSTALCCPLGQPMCAVPGQDPDGDGRTNAQEYLLGTDPTLFDGPGAPTALAPVCGAFVAALTPTLVVANASGLSVPTYEFQIYSDSTLRTSAQNVVQGAATTSWTSAAALSENGVYWWRARAVDAYLSGPWSSACTFVVNAVNEAPTAPGIHSPGIGAQVNATPALVVDDATDPDVGDSRTYTFELYGDAALTSLLESHTAIAETAGTTSTTLTAALAENQWAWWRVRARDSHFLNGPWSATGSFFYSAVNSPPTQPLVLSPQANALVASLTPRVSVLNGTDPDRDPLFYDFELAADATFATVLQSQALVPESPVLTSWSVPGVLTENQRACVRVRANDAQAQSSWSVSCFRVSVVNDAPTVPVLQNPAANSAVSVARPMLGWNAATDPEGDTIAYDVELYADAGLTGSPVGALAGTPSTAGVVPVDLVDGASYWWRVRAVDSLGAASAWSAANPLTVTLPPADLDHDGLPDAWELQYFGGLTAQDGFGDPDHDGRPNLQEYQLGTDPTHYDGPDTPLATCVALSTTLTPTLSVNDATGLTAPRTYEFQVFADSTLVASASGVAEGATVTSWTVQPALTKNSEYWWRARAVDGHVAGAWSPACRTFVNLGNEPPTAPQPVFPADEAQVEAAPALTVANATDPNRDALVYSFALYLDRELTHLVTSVDGVVAGLNGTTTASGVPTLSEDTTYYWRARAVDPSGAAGPWSATSSFFVNAVNEPPSVPVPLSPADRARVDTVTPTLVASVSRDEDRFDVVTYEFELDVSDAFASSSLQTVSGLNSSVWAVPAALTERQTYSWRVRAVDDGGAASDWSKPASFTVGLDSASAAGGGCQAGPRGSGAVLGVTLLALLEARGARRRKRSGQ
jgi:hypothetical protein